MKSNEILTKYNNEMSKLEKEFPVNIETMKQEHKKILSKLLASSRLKSLTNSIQKQIDSSFTEFQKKNEDIYISQLTSFLQKEYQPIKEKISSKSYENISDYVEEIKNFENSLISKIPTGPNKNLHFFEFILDQIFQQSTFRQLTI